MADAPNILSEPPDASDGSAIRQRLLVVSPPANRQPQKDPRPVSSLASVFGRLAEALDEPLAQHEQQLSEVAAQLPDMKERINWLIATYYEEDRDRQAFRERLARQEAGLAALTTAVRGLCETQAQWRQTLEQLMQVLGRAYSAPVPNESVLTE
jgi:septal ring factor EnvC (AmiA/AmiB activator)